MTEYEIETKEKILDYVEMYGVDELSSFEIDFIDDLSDLSDKIKLSDTQIKVIQDICKKLGI